jgi:hypothetical protein
MLTLLIVQRFNYFTVLFTLF